MDEYTPRQRFQNFEICYVNIFFYIFSANCTRILLSAKCKSLLMTKKYLLTFDVICIDFLRCAKRNENGILNELFLHYYDIFRNTQNEVSILQGYLFIHQNLIFLQSVPLSKNTPLHKIPTPEHRFRRPTVLNIVTNLNYLIIFYYS